MIKYSYQAKDKDGKTYTGFHEANNRIELYSKIREEGGSVLSVKELKGSIDLDTIIASIFGGVKTHDKILLARNLGSMIKAGLAVTRALAVMEKQTKNKILAALLSDLSNDVSKGETLSDSMKKRPHVFSQLFVSMVKAGEESGNLADSLEIVASQLEKSYTLVKKVRGALIYPTVILFAMVVIAILMLIYMVPTLTATFSGIGIDLPLSTKIIIYVSDFLVKHTFIVVSGLIGIITLIIMFFRTTTGHKTLDLLTIKLPAIGTITKEIQSARTARTLSSLLSAGVDVVVAIGVTIDVVQNTYYKKVLEEIRVAIQKGELMSGIFEKNDDLYPPFVGEMVAVGEETGKISGMLLEVADYYEKEVDEATKDLSTIIEPVLMIIIGLGVGIFAVSMLAPTYSMVNYI